MDKNMQTLQPRTLSNREFIQYCALWFDESDGGLPPHWQMELLRRFTAVAPLNEHPVHDPKQLDLFK